MRIVSTDASETQEYIARRLSGDAPIGQIVGALVDQGVAPDDAAVIVRRVHTQYREAMAKASLKTIGIGAMWAVGGSAVTAFTFLSSHSTGVFVAAWGAIIFGFFDMIRGFIGWLRYRTVTA
jgi:hypothetical protein